MDFNVIGTDPDFNVIGTDPQFIHGMVADSYGKRSILTAVYGSPNEAFRNSLWKKFEEIGMFITDPWLLIGDFNAVLFDQE